MPPRCSPIQSSSTPSRSAARSPITGTTRLELQDWMSDSIRSSDDARQSTKIVPSRWSTSSWTRCRPMNPVAPVTKYAMGRRYRLVTSAASGPSGGLVVFAPAGTDERRWLLRLLAEHDLVPARDGGSAAGLLDRPAWRLLLLVRVLVQRDGVRDLVGQPRLVQGRLVVQEGLDRL